MDLNGKIADQPLGMIDISHHHVPRVWIVAADDNGFRVFKKKAGYLELLGSGAPDHLTAPHVPTNRSVGRTGSSADRSIHHKYEPHAASGSHEEDIFVKQLSGWMEKAVYEDAFDRLIIAAPPKMLGHLRKSLKKEVRARLVEEVNKDLFHLSEEVLYKELSEVLSSKLTL